jgi:hypothetical protein
MPAQHHTVKIRFSFILKVESEYASTIQNEIAKRQLENPSKCITDIKYSKKKKLRTDLNTNFGN